MKKLANALLVTGIGIGGFIAILLALALWPSSFSALVFAINAVLHWGFGCAWLGAKRTVALGTAMWFLSWLLPRSKN